MSQKLDITAEYLEGMNYRPIHAGDDYDYAFTVSQAGVAIDLTLAKIWFTIKDSSLESDAEAKLQLSSADGNEIQITDAENGKFTVKFRGTGAKATGDLEGLWKYDIQVKTGSDVLITVARGVIEFLPDLTRSTT